MISLVRNSLLMARHAVAVPSRAVYSLPSSNRFSPLDKIKNSSPWKSLFCNFSFHSQVLRSRVVPFPQLVSIAKDLERKAKKEQKKEVSYFCSKMVSINNSHIDSGLKALIMKKIIENLEFEEEDRRRFFEEYDYVAGSCWSRCSSRDSFDQEKIEIEIFWGESISSADAECIPILLLLKKRPHRGLFVTDQVHVVERYESGSKKGINRLMKAILSEVESGSGNRLMYIPSKEFGLYRMCDILSRFVAGLGSTSSELQERKARSIGNACKRINFNDIFRQLSKRC